MPFRSARTLATLAVLFSVVSFARTACAFDDTGHLVIAHIAYHRLEPAPKALMDRLFPLRLESADPLKTRGRERGIVFTPDHVYGPFSIANWMDDLRSNSYDDPLKEWHYINSKPIFDGIPEKPVFPATINIRERIVAMSNQLKENADFTSTPARTDDKLAAEAIAHLAHLVGDVHQPLHCASRYSQPFPNGDSGGNMFKILGPPGILYEGETQGNLHSFWDKTAGLFEYVRLERPLKEDGLKRLGEFSQRVTGAWPADAHTAEWQNLAVEDWIQEGNTLARVFAYQEIKPLSMPTPEYIQKTQEICTQRLALAGYRLAALLNELLKGKE